MKKLIKYSIIITSIIVILLLMPLTYYWVDGLSINDNKYFNNFAMVDLLDSNLTISQPNKIIYNALAQSISQENQSSLIDLQKLYINHDLQKLNDLQNSFKYNSNAYMKYENATTGLSLFIKGSLKTDLSLEMLVHKLQDNVTVINPKYELIDQYIPDNFKQYIYFPHFVLSLKIFNYSNFIKKLIDTNFISDVIKSNKSISKYIKDYILQFENNDYKWIIEKLIDKQLIIANYDNKNQNGGLLIAFPENKSIHFINKIKSIIDVFINNYSISENIIEDFKVTNLTINESKVNIYYLIHSQNVFVSTNISLIKQVISLIKAQDTKSAKQNLNLSSAKLSNLDKYHALVYFNLEDKKDKRVIKPEFVQYNMINKYISLLSDDKKNNEPIHSYADVKITQSKKIQITFREQLIQKILTSYLYTSVSKKNMELLERVMKNNLHGLFLDHLNSGEFLVVNGYAPENKDFAIIAGIGVPYDNSDIVKSMSKSIFTFMSGGMAVNQLKYNTQDIFYIDLIKNMQPCFSDYKSHLIFASNIDLLKGIIEDKELIK